MKQRGRRLLSMLLSIVMLLTMVPVSVLADDSSVVTATSYEELVEYLNDTSLTQITIAGQHRNAYAGVYEPFRWPEGDVTLNLDGTNADLYVQGPWVIPANVTVNVARPLWLMYAMNGTPSITVDGTWNITGMNGKVHATNPYGGYARSLTISESGKLTSNGGAVYGNVAPVAQDAALKLNGTMDLNGRVAEVSTWLLGRNVNVSSDTVLYLGSGAYLACEEGGAVIDGELIAGTNGWQTGTATMGGKFTAKKIMMDRGGQLIIEEGAHITAKSLYSSGTAYEEVLTVKGTLELAARPANGFETHLFNDNVTMDIADNGTLILRPSNRLTYAEEETASITGSGIIKLYALYDAESGSYTNYPAVFGYADRRNGEPHQVAETVEIWNNWSADCSHSWSEEPVDEMGGENIYHCTECGTEKRGDGDASGGSGSGSGSEPGGSGSGSGSEPGGSGSGSESGELHTLSAATNVKWGTFYYANGTESFDYNGMIAWTVTDTAYEHDYDVRVYKEGVGEVFGTGWGYRPGRSVNMSDHDFSLSCLEELGSGRYYFTVQAIGDGETTANSAVVQSDVWVYTVPTAQLAAPENLRWENGVAKWDAVTDANAGGYNIGVYYSEDRADATVGDIDDLDWTDDRFVWYFGEGLTSSSYTPRSMRDKGAGYYYFQVKTISGDLEKAGHSAFSSLSEAYYYDGAGGYRLYYEYDPELCSINVYNSYDENQESIESGGMLPAAPGEEHGYGVFEILDIAEGYRIGAVYLNGEDVSERFITGAYGECAMSITEDSVLEVFLEEIPQKLPEIRSAVVFEQFAGEFGDGPVTEINFIDNSRSRLQAVIEFVGGGYPDYYASGIWQYSVDDGATWNNLREWGERTDFWAGWSGFRGMDVDFLNDSYLLRMKVLPLENYSVLKNDTPIYTDVIAVNGNTVPTVPAVQEVTFSEVDTTNEGITMNWTMETPKEGGPSLESIDSLEFWMLNSTTSQWKHFHTASVDEDSANLSRIIGGSDLTSGEYTRIRVWSMANGYDENDNEVKDAKYEQDISLTITLEEGSDGAASWIEDLGAKVIRVTMTGLTPGLETMLYVRSENRINSRRFADIRVAKAAGTSHKVSSYDLYDIYYSNAEELASAWYTLRQMETSVISDTEADITILDLSGWKQFDKTEEEECDHTGTGASCNTRPICTKCGKYFGEPLGHNWELTSDFGHHWYKCTRCGTRDGNYVEHSYEDVKDCEVEIRCDVCNYLIRKAKEHDPRGGNRCEDTITCYDCDKVLSTPTGHSWGEYEYDRDCHYRECRNCFTWEEERHFSGEDTDCSTANLCTACHYVIREAGTHIPGECVPKSDYWHQVKCASCGTDMHLSSHSYGSNANCETGLTCVECGYVKAEPGEHHVPDEYDYSAYRHWKMCSVCYMEFEGGSHTLVTDPYQAPTATTPGKTEGSHCSVCGYVAKAQQTIPVVEEQEVWWLFDEMEWTYGDVGMIYNEAYNDSDGGSELTYSGDNDAVALVNPEDGTLTIKGAGTVTITATAAAVPGKYMETSARFVLTVEKAGLTVTPNPVDIIYGMAPTHDGYTVTGFVLGADESVLQGTPEYSYTYAQYDTVGDGEYAICVTGLTAANYEITFVEGILCVEKAENYTITLGDLEQTAGKTTAVTAAIDPQDSTAQISVEYLVDDIWTETVPTAAGSYEVRAALVDSENIVPDGSYTTAVLTVKPSSTVGNTTVTTEKDENGSAKIEVTEEDLEEIINNLPEDGQLDIDVSTVEDVEDVVIPGKLIQSLEDSEKVEQLNITSADASISMGGEVLSTMANAVTGKDDTIALQMTSVEAEELTEEQQKTLESITTSMDTVIVEVSLVVTHYDEKGEESGTTSIHQLGGNVEVTVKYPEESVKGKYVIVCYLSDDGSVTYTRATYNAEDGTITFKTNHFSTFALIVNEDPVVQVNGGTGDGIYAAGSTVTVAAVAKAGHDFLRWQVDEGDVTLSDPEAETVAFTMPAGEVELTALYSMRPAEAVWNAEHTALTVRNGCEGAATVMVAFYDQTTGQMLMARVLTAEEVLAGVEINGGSDFINCTAKAMFLTGKMIPVAEAVQPQE